MKLLQLLVLVAAVMVDATQTRRLRVRGGDVNERYIDLAAEIDESVKDRVARRVQKEDITAARKENLQRALTEDSVSLSLSFSLDSRVDLSMSMSLSMSMGGRVGEPKLPKGEDVEDVVEDQSISMSLSMSI